MSPDTAQARTGVFISHAHEDEELAEALREHLETVLGLDRASITCTSDPNYGLARGSELTDQIRQRLNSAKALFLLATSHSKGKEWVQFECAYADQANTKGEMQFYVLTPSAIELESVPAPYRGRVAVTLSKAGDLHEFAAQLRKTFGVTAESAGTPRFLDTLLKLHTRADDAERRELALKTTALEEKHRVIETQSHRLRRHRMWGFAAAAVTAIAFGVSFIAQRNEMKTLKLAHEGEIERRILEMETQRDDELRSLPFSGFFQDANNRVVPCVRVTAILAGQDGNRRVTKDCKGGRFTFDSRELGVDPRERFTLAVDVPNDSRDFTVDRSTLPVAMVISGVNR